MSSLFSRHLVNRSCVVVPILPNRFAAAKTKSAKATLMKKKSNTQRKIIPVVTKGMVQGSQTFFDQIKMLTYTSARKSIPLSEEQSDNRAWMLKKWSSYCQDEYLEWQRGLKQRYMEQQHALERLKILSPKFYASAFETDNRPFPATARIPTETPPIPGYKREHY